MESFRVTVSADASGSRQADVFFKNYQFADVSKVLGELRIKLYFYPDKQKWELPLNGTIDAFDEAKSRLLTPPSKEIAFSTKKDFQQINDQSEEVLDQILSHPERRETSYIHKKYGPVVEIETPDAGGARFLVEDNKFLGFLEPMIFLD